MHWPPFSQKESLGVGLFCIVSVIFSYLRIYLGVDFTDDAFYAALPYVFSHGARPLVDEIQMGQFSGLLLLPFVFFHQALVGSQQGLVLFLKHLFFLSSGLVSLSLFLYLKPQLQWKRSLMVAVFLLSFIPYSLASLSYNTMSYLALMMALLCWMSPQSNSKFPGFLLAGTFFLAISVFAYPPFLVGALMIAGLQTARLMRQKPSWVLIRKSGVWHALAFVAFSALGFGFYQWVGGYSSFYDLYLFHHELALEDCQGGGWGVLRILMRQGGSSLPYLVVGSTLFSLLFFLQHKVSHPVVHFFLGLVFLYVLLKLESNFNVGLSSHDLMWFLGVVGLMMLGLDLMRKKMKWTSPWVLLGFGGLMLVLSVSWASTDRLHAGSIAMYPLVLFFLVRLSLALDATHRFFFFGVLLSLTLFSQKAVYQFVYRDDAVEKLTTRIPSGAFWGLYTTPLRAQFLSHMETLIDKQIPDHKSILFYDDFPAGYLLSERTMKSPSVWIWPEVSSCKYNREMFVSYFKKKENLPHYIVQMKKRPQKNGGVQNLVWKREDKLTTYFTSQGYLPQYEDEWLTISKKQSEDPL